MLYHIVLLLNIQYDDIKNIIGTQVSRQRLFLVSVSSRAGGNLYIQAIYILSAMYWFRIAMNAIGNKIGIPVPYIKVTNVMLRSSEYLKWMTNSQPLYNLLKPPIEVCLVMYGSPPESRQRRMEGTKYEAARLPYGTNALISIVQVMTLPISSYHPGSKSENGPERRSLKNYGRKGTS